MGRASVGQLRSGKAHSGSLHGKLHGTPGQAGQVGFPGFPVGTGGVDGLHAAFLNESRTRGGVQCTEAGNPGFARDYKGEGSASMKNWLAAEGKCGCS
jgi:hypothetical protein